MAWSTPARPLRADAVRNHQLVLDAADQLVSEQGAEHVTLERVAHASGVGKGTVQRRFGSRAGLLQALLERRANSIRAALDSTYPPLGSNAPPRERLLALLDALSQLAADNTSLLAEHEQACAADKYADPSYQTWHRHLTAFIAELNYSIDAEALAHMLLATIDGRLVRQLDPTNTTGRFRTNLINLAAAAVDHHEHLDQA